MKRGKNLLYILIALGLLAGGAYIIYKNQKETKRQSDIISRANTEIPVNIATAKFEHVSDRYVSNGTLEPLKHMQLSSEIAGKITRVLVQEGDYISKGQTLAVIKKDALEVSHANALAAYQNALASNQRYENAFKTGGVTKQQLDQSRLQLKQAKNMLKQANIQVGDANVKTLISGIVNDRMVEPGAVVAPGTPLFDIVNVSKLKLKVSVTENKVASLKLGDRVKVKISVYPDKEFYGNITFIAPIADASLNFPVEITMNNTDQHELRAGMYGTAIFSEEDKGEQNSYLLIPKNAFVGGLSSHQVFVVNKDNTVKLTNVVVGSIFGDQVQIISGLEEGTKVVTSGTINLIDGAKISVIK